MRGRPRKPTELKKLQGNPGKRPLPRNEPRPARDLPYCPAHLNDEAKREWKRIVHTLYDTGLLTKVDKAALAMYCQAWGRWVEAENQVAINGDVVKTKQGNIIQNPYLSISNRAWDQLSKMIQQFGLSPAARARLTVQPEYEQLSLADLLFPEEIRK